MSCCSALVCILQPVMVKHLLFLRNVRQHSAFAAGLIMGSLRILSHIHSSMAMSEVPKHAAWWVFHRVVHPLLHVF